MTYLMIIAGFVFLIKGADYLVDGAASLAKKFKISDLVVGLTIIAFGTSAPEMVVNIMSSIQGNTDIAIGNVLGSNTANILLILGIAALIYPLKIKHSVAWRDIPLSLLAVLVVGFMVNDKIFDGQAFSILSRIDGLILLCFFAIFIYYIYTVAITSKATINSTTKEFTVLKSLGLFCLGMIGLIIGGRLAVTGAINLATTWGMSQSFIGLTIVAIGTSLPELFTCAVAAKKHNADIAVGGIVGSNILNIFWVLGVSSVIVPIPFDFLNNLDIFVLLAATILIMLWIILSKKYTLTRVQGGIMVFLYLAYLGYLVYMG
ncbi:MAG: calcium/sodium antiporter [bacterium]